MADHGTNFAYWLRDKLMKRFSHHSTNAVYVDCIASRQKKSLHFAAGEAPLRGIALTFPPDTRGQASQAQPGLGPQGAATNGMPANNPAGVQQIPVTKVYGMGGLLWHREDYTISEDAFNRLAVATGL